MLQRVTKRQNLRRFVEFCPSFNTVCLICETNLVLNISALHLAIHTHIRQFRLLNKWDALVDEVPSTEGRLSGQGAEY
jgi:hypothetical protein